MSSSDFIRWASIEGLPNLKRKYEKYESFTPAQRQTLEGELTFFGLLAAGAATYASKVKLHGTNNSVVLKEYDEVQYQSRNGALDPGSKGSGQGFAFWAKQNLATFKTIRATSIAKGYCKPSDVVVVFGEWCGPGIQKHVALAQLKTKIFCIFSVRAGDALIVEPEHILSLIGGEIPAPAKGQLFVLPWFSDERLAGPNHRDITLKFESEIDMTKALIPVNDIVDEIDSEDPWVKENFKISGAGEGLVWYPTSEAGKNLPSTPIMNQCIHAELFEFYSFKTKGESHQMVGGKKPPGKASAAKAPQSGAAKPNKSQERSAAGAADMLKVKTAATPAEFAAMFCTPARFEQGLSELAVASSTGAQVGPESLGAFVDWLVKDVKKESKDELEASKLTWTTVEPHVQSISTQWFRTQGPGGSEAAPSASSPSQSNNPWNQQKPTNVFARCKVCFSDRIGFKTKSELGSAIKYHGGIVSFMMVQSQCTHLVATAEEVENGGQTLKVRTAIKAAIPMVSTQWITESITKSELLPPRLFALSCAAPTESSAQVVDTSAQFSDEDLEQAKKVAVWTFGAKEAPDFPNTSADFRIVQRCALHLMDFEANSNKFYSMEIHEALVPALTKFPYRIFTHHGRTDDLEKKQNVGQKQCRFVATLSQAKALYSLIFAEKTHPDKGYKEVHLISPSKKIGFTGNAPQRAVQTQSGPKSTSTTDSTLAKPIQELTKFLFDQANESIKKDILCEVSVDGIETPLGILAMKQIELGEETLKELFEAVTTSPDDESKLRRLSSQFYSLIPHRLGTKKSEVEQSLINTAEAFEEKQNLLQLMKDVIRLHIDKNVDVTKPLIDRQYEALQCEVSALDTASAEFRRIEATLTSTMPACKEDFRPVKIVNIYKIKRQSEHIGFNKAVGNEKLLLHASRTANFAGLLSRGMLLPQIVVSKGFAARTDFGFLGAGLYFSDSLYSSIKYTSTPSFKAHPLEKSRFMLAASVALGREFDTRKVLKDLTEAPVGFNSVHALPKSPAHPNSDFINHEFVVYLLNQVRLDYIVQFHMSE